MIVGVTNEPSSLVERDAVKKNMNFPIAMVKGERTDRAFGIKGYPSAVLVDARGRVFWSGHPGSFPESALEGLLAAQTYIPALEGKKHSKINKSLRQRELGKAHAALVKALGRTPEDTQLLAARDAIEASASRMLADAKALAAAEDFGTAQDLYGEVAGLFSGMETAATAKAEAKALDKLPEAKRELAAHKLLSRAREYLATGDKRRALPKLESLVKKYEDTLSGGRAAVLLRRHGG